METIKYEDLEKYKVKYNYFTTKYLSEKNENRVLFLNAEYGWGKTTFLEKIMKIKENNFYSAWLNHQRDYLNEVFYITNKVNPFKNLIIVLGIILFIGTLTMISDPIFTYFLNCFTPEIKTLIKFAVMLLFIIILICFWIYYYGFFFLNIFRKDYNEYLENKFLDRIIKKINSCLVIEDVDRLNETEIIEIMKFAKRLSDRILEKEKAKNKWFRKIIKKDRNNKKYILLTGEMSRVINLLNKQQMYYKQTYIEFTSSLGTYTFEKVIGCKIEFLSILSRIKHLLSEYGINHLSPIEYDEIECYVYKKTISVRFFDLFLQDNLLELKKTNRSSYHLLQQFYMKEKMIFSTECSLEELLCFPNCLNDIELLFQKKQIHINNKDYSYKNFLEKKTDNEFIDLINKILFNLLSRGDLYPYFEFYYKNGKYPVFQEDISPNDRHVNVGKELSDNFKNTLKSYILSYPELKIKGYYDIQTQNLPQSRCYLTKYDQNYSFQKNREKCELIPDLNKKHSNIEMFTASYLGAFFKENISEFEKSYPELNKKLK